MVLQQRQHDLLCVAKHIRRRKTSFRDLEIHPLKGSFMLLDLILERLQGLSQTGWIVFISICGVRAVICIFCLCNILPKLF